MKSIFLKHDLRQFETTLRRLPVLAVNALRIVFNYIFYIYTLSY